MIYGVIWGINDPKLLCNTIYKTERATRLIDNSFLNWFRSIDDKIEDKFSELFHFFYSKPICFSIKSGFDLSRINDVFLSNKDKVCIRNPFNSIELQTEVYSKYYMKYRSLLLAIFCSPIVTNKNLFITGDIDFSTCQAKAVTDIEAKFQVVISRIKESKLIPKECEFVYIVSKGDREKIKNGLDKLNKIGINIQPFEQDTPLSDILYYLQNSTVVREEDKYVYTKIINKELNANKANIEQIDFYFSGDECSTLLYDTSIFQTINSLITKEFDFQLHFYHIKYYASEQRMNGNKKKPQWINNFIQDDELNYPIINRINDKLSLFASNLQTQFRMFVDTYLKNSSKVTIKNYETDNNDFFNKGYEKSAIKITYKDGSSWICHSDVYDQGKKCIYIFKIKKPNESNNEMQQFNSIEKAFTKNVKDNKSSSDYKHWVLIGFPGSGKSSTAKFFARMEHLGDNDLENSKIISSDDRINNRTFADSADSKILRSKSDFANPSRNEAKAYVAKQNKSDKKDEDIEKDLEIYDDIEYTARNRVVETSINLSYILDLPCDLGAKEILEPATRVLLFMRDFKTIFLLNAKTPLREEDFCDAKRNIPSLSENTWECVKVNLPELKKKENEEIVGKISDNAFECYFTDVFDKHPEIADEAARRNIYRYKLEALGGICEKNCPYKDSGCSNKCEHWTSENKTKFKEKLKEEIWDKRFLYYLDYCQHFIIRQPTIKETADAINDIVKSPMYCKEKPEPQLPYYNNEIDSFALFTVQNRFHQIWESAFDDNLWKDFVNEHKVSEYLDNKYLGKIGDTLKKQLSKYKSKKLNEYFSEAEFLQSEFFLYHIMNDEWEKTGKSRFELFLNKKEKDWNEKENTYLKKWLEKIVYQTSSLKKDIVNKYLHLMTSGNSHDLSQENDYNPTDDIQYIHYDISNGDEKANIKRIVNDDNIYNFLSKRKYRRFDILSDNAGVELFNDCLFAWYLLQTNTVEKIVIHVKPCPMFVSDATEKDFEKLKSIIKDYDKTVYKMLTQYETKNNESNQNGEGRLVIQSDEEDFYVPEFKDCNYIQDIMNSGCELLIVKGDLNYRRLVGDLHWAWTQPIKPIIAPFVTCRCLCLRCIKSDVLLGLNEVEANVVSCIPRKKLTSGKYATIQFV